MLRLRLIVPVLAVLASCPPVTEAQPARSMPLIVPAGDGFGREVTFEKHSFVYVTGHADFDGVYDALVAALKKVRGYLDREGIAAAGPAIARYRDGGQEGFQFEAGYPVAQAPKALASSDIEVGETPSGKVLDFVHRGSFNTIDETYAAIDDFFRDRRKSAGLAEPDAEHDELAQSFEEYTTDPLTADPEKLEVHVLVPVK